jgi:hypothetical protein
MPVQISGHLKGSVNILKVHLSTTLLTYPNKKESLINWEEKQKVAKIRRCEERNPVISVPDF